MITGEQIKNLNKVSLDAKGNLLSQINALQNSIANFNYWYIKTLQPRVPFLKYINPANLNTLGLALIQNLSRLKTYNALTVILRALYGQNSTVRFLEFGTNNPNGTIEINIAGVESVLPKLITVKNEFVKTVNGNQIVLIGYGGVANDLFFDDFFKEIIAAGVQIIGFNIINSNTLTFNGATLTFNGATLTTTTA